MTDENRTLKDAFYGSNFRVGQGLLTRDKSTDSNDLTESSFENIQTWDELTDQVATGEAFDELTDSEQGMDDSTESNMAMDVVTDKKPAMDKVTDKEVAMDKVTDKEMPMDKVTDKEVAMDKVTDKEMPMDKVTDKEMPMDKVTDKEVAMDKVMSKLMARSKFLDSSLILDYLWSKIQASDIFWQGGTANEIQDAVITFPEDDGVTVLDIRVDSNSEADGGEWFLEFDAENIAGDELVVSERLVDSDFNSSGRIRIQIDGTTEFEEQDPTHTDYRETRVDIPNSGTFEVKFIADRYESDFSDDDSWRVKEVRFE